MGSRPPSSSSLESSDPELCSDSITICSYCLTPTGREIITKNTRKQDVTQIRVSNVRLIAALFASIAAADNIEPFAGEHRQLFDLFDRGIMILEKKFLARLRTSNCCFCSSNLLKQTYGEKDYLVFIFPCEFSIEDPMYLKKNPILASFKRSCCNSYSKTSSMVSTLLVIAVNHIEDFISLILINLPNHVHLRQDNS